MRQRSLAVALLDALSERCGQVFDSIASVSQLGTGGLRILDTDNFSAISQRLRDLPNYLRCSYLPAHPWGSEVSPGYFNIDLQRIDFADASFDFVLSSDVMEHVRDCDAAHAEIYRILRPGGTYIFNVPYVEESAHNIVLVDTTTPKDIYLCPPQFHGDPLSNGVLAYRVFGRELIGQLSALGFAVRFLRLDRQDSMIIEGDVFVAQKGE
jgi:SAM-dependent methyltransferase